MTSYGQGDLSFQTAGGIEGVQRLVEAFYDAMSTRTDAQTIHAMHPDIEISIDKLACFLCGWLGGPKRYSEKYGGIAIPPAHQHLPIGESEKAAWLNCMKDAIEQQPYPADFKQYLLEQLAVPAGRIVALQENRRQAMQQ